MRDTLITAALFLATVAASALAVGPQAHHAAVARIKAGGGVSYSFQEALEAAHASAYGNLSTGGNTRHLVGLSPAGSSYTVTRLEFLLKATGSPTFTIEAKIWSDDGADAPLSLLATSTSTLDASTVAASATLYTFDFAGLAVTSGTLYHWGLYADATGDSSNHIDVRLGSTFSTSTEETSGATTVPVWNSQSGGRSIHANTYVSP